MPGSLDLTIYRGDTYAHALWFPDLSAVTVADLADRPAPTTNALFYAVDTNTLYQVVTGAWVAVPVGDWRTVLDDLDLSGRDYAAAIRRGPNGMDVWPLTVDTTGAATGDVVLRLTAAESNVLPAAMSGRWDLQETVDTTVTTILAGDVDVDPDIDR